MDNSPQHFGNQWNCDVPKIIDTQDILLTNLSFPEESQTSQFRELRQDMESESSAKKLVDLLSYLPEHHIAQAVIRLEVARTFFSGNRCSDVVRYCEEALAVLDSRAASAEPLQGRYANGSYDNRLRFDLLELAAAAHEFDGDDALAFGKWIQLPSAASAALRESFEDPGMDLSSRRELVDEMVASLAEGWYSASLLVPEKLKEVQRIALSGLLSAALDAMNTLLPAPIQLSELSGVSAERELLPTICKVLYLAACDASKRGEYLTTEKLLSKRLEVVQDLQELDPLTEEARLWSSALRDLLRTRIDRGAISLATESARELLSKIKQFPPGELGVVLKDIRAVLQLADQENFNLLFPLIARNFKRSPQPRIWVELMGDVAERLLDSDRVKSARRLLSIVNERIDIASDNALPTAVKASLLYSQIRCLFRIDENYHLSSELSPVAISLLDNLTTLLLSETRTFENRCFYLMMVGGLKITALRGNEQGKEAIALCRRIVLVAKDEDIADDSRILGALYYFSRSSLELHASERYGSTDLIKPLFLLLSRANAKRICNSRAVMTEEIATLAIKFTEVGRFYLSLIPDLTQRKAKINGKFCKLLPPILSRIDSENLTDEVLTMKIVLLESLVASFKTLKGEDSPEFKETSDRLESATRALLHRMKGRS